MIYTFFDEKSKGNGVANNEIKQNQQLAEELHKPIIKLKKTVYSGFEDNIWGADLEGAQLISTFNKGFRFLLGDIDIVSKYTWVVPLKESNRKPNNIQVDKGSEFYNISFKNWLKDNDTEMYSTHNEGKSVVAERLIRTLKATISKYMTSI